MKPKRNRGSITTNLDNTLSDAQRDAIEKDEWNTHVIDEATRESEAYQYQGFLGRNSALTFEQDSWDSEDVRGRKQRGEPVIPVFSILDEEGEIVWILTDEDRSAVEQGYVCERCLSWQRFPHLPKCEMDNGNSCGYVRRVV